MRCGVRGSRVGQSSVEAMSVNAARNEQFNRLTVCRFEIIGW